MPWPRQASAGWRASLCQFSDMGGGAAPAGAARGSPRCIEWLRHAACLRSHINAEIVRKPGDAENTLRLLLHQLRLLRVPAEAAGKHATALPTAVVLLLHSIFPLDLPAPRLACPMPIWRPADRYPLQPRRIW